MLNLKDYLNATDILEKDRIVSLLEDLYNDGETILALTSLIEDIKDELDSNLMYDEAYDSAEGTNTYYMNKEKIELLDEINVSYILSH